MKRAFILLICLAAISTAAEEPQRATQRLRAFVGEFDGTFEQQVKKGEWNAAPVTLRGSAILAGHYVELRGTLHFASFENPTELILLWSYDPFQQRVRLVALDDFAGLLDVFEQESATPLRLSNVSHGTFFEDASGRRSYSSVTIQFLDDDSLRMRWSGSMDGGKTWTEISRLTLRRKSR